MLVDNLASCRHWREASLPPRNRFLRGMGPRRLAAEPEPITSTRRVHWRSGKKGVAAAARSAKSVTAEAGCAAASRSRLNSTALLARELVGRYAPKDEVSKGAASPKGWVRRRSRRWKAFRVEGCWKTQVSDGVRWKATQSPRCEGLGVAVPATGEHVMQSASETRRPTLATEKARYG